MSLNRDKINIPLKSNYKNLIKPTNSLRENEYETTIIIPYLLDGIENNFYIGNIDISFNLNYHFNKFWIVVSIYNFGDDIGINKNNLSKDLIITIAKRIIRFIEELNYKNYQFISFENQDKDEYIQIYNGKIYGLIYDLNTNTPIEPAKIIKTSLIFEYIDYDDIIDKIMLN